MVKFTQESRQYDVLSLGTKSAAGPDLFTREREPFLSPSLKGNRVEQRVFVLSVPFPCRNRVLILPWKEQDAPQGTLLVLLQFNIH